MMCSLHVDIQVYIRTFLEEWKKEQADTEYNLREIFLGKKIRRTATCETRMKEECLFKILYRSMRPTLKEITS